MTNLQQKTFNIYIYWQKYGFSLEMIVKLLNNVEIIVAKGKIACHKQFILLLQLFQKLSAVGTSE